MRPQKHFSMDKGKNSTNRYLPTPPFGQDMTQGQFLSRV